MRTADVAAAAMDWLGRGQGFEALAREIAWTASHAAGAHDQNMAWLGPLVEVQLGEWFDQLPSVLRQRAVAVEADYLRERPYDLAGADLCAAVAAREAAIEHLSTVYLDTLDWTVGLLRARQESNERVRGWRRRRKRAEEGPVYCDVPQRIVDGLTQWLDEPGWPERRAA
jgi:hypothetical protein